MKPEDEAQLQVSIEQAWLAANQDSVDSDEEMSDETIPQSHQWEVVSSPEATSFASQLSSAVDELRPHLTNAVEQIRKETGLRRVRISIGFRVEPVLQVTIED